MTLFLQYNMNNHIPDDVHFLWWPSVLPDSESMSLLSKGLLNLEPPLCSSGYVPVYRGGEAQVEGEMEPFKDHPSTHVYPSSLRNKPQQKQPAKHLSPIPAWTVRECVQVVIV